MPSSKRTPALPRQLTTLHRELGIPATYAADRRLAPQLEASESDLVEVGISDEGRPIRLVRLAAESWALMRLAAGRDDVELFAMSGFRTIARQTEIFRGKLAAGEPLDDILRYVAAPGFSEHHTGRALDIGSPEHTELDEAFGETGAFRWLDENAARFGFRLSYPRSNPHGIAYEPWHWCWTETTAQV
ncbi:MAG: M15 family metallopeptidase [Opitutaceae bacterium]